MKLKTSLAISLLALVTAFLPLPSDAQIKWGGFAILGCQGGIPNGNASGPQATVDGSGNFVTQTSNPTFSVWVSTGNNTSATGLVGNVCGGAAYASPSASVISGVQGLWNFDSTLNDSSSVGNNLSLGNLNGGLGGPIYANSKNSGALGTVGLKKAFHLGTATNGGHEFGQSASPIDFSGFGTFSVEAWVNVSEGDNCSGGGGACPAPPNNGCSGGFCNFATCTDDGVTACASDCDCISGCFSGTCPAPNACVSGSCLASGDVPILLDCPAQATDQCLHIDLRPAGNIPSNCNTPAVAAAGLTPYFGFFNDDVCGGSVTTVPGWHHLVFVAASSGQKTIYEDGVIVSGGNIGTQAKFAGTASTVYVGGAPVGVTNEGGQTGVGDIDAVRIYSQALQGGTIASHAFGNWFSIAADTKFDQGLSGQFCPGGGAVPATPVNPNWQWGFGSGRNIIPTAGGANTNIPFIFTETDTNEYIQESNAQNVVTADVEQLTMSLPPAPFQVATGLGAAWDQTHLSFAVPAWFCSAPPVAAGPANANANLKYSFGIGNCGASDCTGITPAIGGSATGSQINYAALNTNTRYNIDVEATYKDAAPGNGVVVGPSLPELSTPTAVATLAYPPDVPTGPVTTGDTSVSIALNLTKAGDVPVNPAYTAIEVQGSNDNGATWIQLSPFLAFNATGGSPRLINGLNQSSKYIFRARNENLDGIETPFSADTFTGGAVPPSAVTQPLTPPAFSGTSAQGTPGLACPKTQIMWTWNAVPIGSNQAPGAAATFPQYLMTDQSDINISSGSIAGACIGGVAPAIGNCQKNTYFLEGDGFLNPGGLTAALTPGTLYTRRIFAYDNGAPSAPDIRFSAFQRTSAQTAPALINAPTNIVPVSLVGGISWSWTAPPNLCAPFQYTVIDPTLAPFPFLAVPGPNPFDNPAAVVTYSQAGLGPNVEKSIRVSAQDNVGAGETGPLSASVTGYTQAFPPINLIFVSVSTGSMVLQWNANGNPAYTRYEVSESPDNFTILISTPYRISDNLTGTSAGITSLLTGTTYYFRVRAFNGQNFDASGTVFTSYIFNQAMTLFNPPAVTGAALSNSSIDWSWPSIANMSPPAYQIVQNPVGGVAPATPYIPPYGFPATLHYTVTGLNTNGQYGVQVQALNGQGLPSPSPFVNVYTQANPPTHLAGGDISGVSSNTITYQWSANGNPAGTFYEIDVATNPSYNTVITTSTPHSTVVTVAGLFPLTTYFAELRAYNGDLVPTVSVGPGTNNGYLVLASTRTNGDPNVSQSSAPPNVYQVAGNAAGQWHFDEDTGTVSADVSGYGDSAQLTCISNGCTSTPTWTSGPAGLGSAVNYSGQTKSFVQINDGAQFHFTTSLVIEAWVNPATLAEINGAGLVAKGPFNGEDFYLDVFNSKYRFSGCTGASSNAAVSAQAIVPGQWTHVAGTYNSGTGVNNIYINGVLAGAGTCGARDLPTGIPTLVNVTVGNRLSGTPAYDLGFNGKIDEVRIINGFLSGSQVQQDYLAAFPSTVTMLGANMGLKIVVPPNAFGGAATIYATNDPVNHPLKISVPELMQGLANEPTRQFLIPGMFVEIVPIVNGTQFTGLLGSTATIIIPYNDANNDGLIDGFTPAIAASTLKVYTLDTSIGQWVYLPTVVDTFNHLVMAQTPHFSVFGAFGTTTTGITTTEARVHPVPWKPGSGGIFDATNLTFDTLPAEGSVRIYTLAGQKVFDIQFSASNAGTVVWNGTNFAGRPAASGVYFALIKTTTGSTRVLKFAIER